jgi:hypothetical protein
VPAVDDQTFARQLVQMLVTTLAKIAAYYCVRIELRPKEGTARTTPR